MRIGAERSQRELGWVAICTESGCWKLHLQPAQTSPPSSDLIGRDADRLGQSEDGRRCCSSGLRALSGAPLVAHQAGSQNSRLLNITLACACWSWLRRPKYYNSCPPTTTTPNICPPDSTIKGILPVSETP